MDQNDGSIFVGIVIPIVSTVIGFFVLIGLMISPLGRDSNYSTTTHYITIIIPTAVSVLGMLLSFIFIKQKRTKIGVAIGFFLALLFFVYMMSGAL
jgi:ABC-type spermidine/putrescine transport system permease subunit II